MTSTIGITANPLTLIEDEGTTTTITFNVEGEIPDEGVIIILDNNTPGALGDLDVFSFDVSFVGSQLVAGNADNSGLSLRITENIATVTLPIFDDDDLPPDDPNATRNDDIGLEETTFFLVEDEAYNVDPNASQITLTLVDTITQLNTPPVAVNDNYTTAFETALTVNQTEGILSNDNDDDGDEITANILTQPQNG
ncbi:MAG: Ig-like domain-containing protein, partial [Microcoleaceae cyanobacterium]